MTKGRQLKLFLFSLAILSLLGVLGLSAQSLWRDHNPYALGNKLKQGSILKLSIDEPVLIVYEYEHLSDENIDINLVPDRNITGFLPPANANRNISKRFAKRLTSRGRMRLHMAVTLDSDPENESLSFRGTKLLGQENNISRQQIQVSGRVHIEDISSGRVINSRDVADLRITLLGAPVPRSAALPLEEEAQKDEPQQNEEKSAKAPAQLSDEQKRRLLWEYINRLLGESL